MAFRPLPAPLATLMPPSLRGFAEVLIPTPISSLGRPGLNLGCIALGLEPLGAVERLGSGLALGEGKMLLGMLANDRAKTRTKITKTMITQGCARTSVRGGRAPR